MEECTQLGEAMGRRRGVADTPLKKQKDVGFEKETEKQEEEKLASAVFAVLLLFYVMTYTCRSYTCRSLLTYYYFTPCIFYPPSRP